MAYTVCLDAGHYGKANRSPAVKTYYESEIMWKLHLLLQAELEKRGIRVVTTRAAQQKDLTLTARGKKAKGCDLFLSLHSNAPGSAVREDLDYPLVIVMLDGKGHALGRKLADCIASTMGTKQTGRITTKKGVSGEYYGVLRGAASVGVMGMILEHSFHTNTRSTKWLLQESNLQKLAKAEADIIAAHLGEKPTCAVKLPQCRRGDRGREVTALQKLLGLSADGIFGPATETAVKKFQTGADLAADGICGAKTWAAVLGGSL